MILIIGPLLWYMYFFLLIRTPFISGRVVVQGPGPGPRYGHVMALVGQRFLLCIGGNDGRLLLHVL